MTDEAKRLATSVGALDERVSQHVSQPLTAPLLASSDLVIALARVHRRESVEISPSTLRRTFTLLELPRLLEGIDDEALRGAAGDGQPTDRLAALLAMIAARRGVIPAANNPEADDVIDPYGRSEQTYQRSLDQIEQAIPSVERVVRAALA